MKSAIEKALDNVKNLNVQALEAPKPEKPKKGEPVISAYDDRPTLYLDNKELTTIRDYKIGDSVVIVCQGKVQELSSYSKMEGKESNEVTNICIKVESIADITKG
jgi:hypothetical protein